MVPRFFIFSLNFYSNLKFDISYNSPQKIKFTKNSQNLLALTIDEC